MSDQNRIKVLLVTDHFPPEQSGGSGRGASLSRYLPEYGIEVFTVTLNFYGKMIDEKNILRYQSFLGWVKQPFSARFIAKTPAKIQSCYGPNIDKWWIKQVLADFKRIADLNCDLIYASYPSSSALLLGQILAGRLNRPLIVEFRDGMCFDPVEKISPFRSAKFAGFEKQLVRQAQSIITIGRSLSSYFETHYGLNNVFTVYNGFNREDFLSIPAAANRNHSTVARFVHFGSLSLSRSRNTAALFLALAQLAAEGVITQQNFHLDLIGCFTPAEKAVLKKFQLENYLSYLEPLPKQEGFARIKNHYDYLLLYGIPQSPSFISAKLPEYLALDKPILGICAGNEAAEIIQSTGTGEVCGFSVQEIKECFIKFINKQANYQPDAERISAFERSRQAGQIAAIILKAVKNGK